MIVSKSVWILYRLSLLDGYSGEVIILAAGTQFSGRYQESRLALFFCNVGQKNLGHLERPFHPSCSNFNIEGGGGGRGCQFN